MFVSCSVIVRFVWFLLGLMFCDAVLVIESWHSCSISNSPSVASAFPEVELEEGDASQLGFSIAE